MQRAGRLDARQNSHDQRLMGKWPVASCRSSPSPPAERAGAPPTPGWREEVHFIECPSPQPHSFLAGRGRKLLVALSRCARGPPCGQVALRVLATPVRLDLPAFFDFWSRLVWALTALSMDLTRSKSGLGVTPVASKAATRALASSMSGCSFNSSAIVVERSCLYFLFPSIRRAYARAWLSKSTPALIRGVITSAAMSGLNNFATRLSRTIGAHPPQRTRLHFPPLQLLPRSSRPVVLGAGHENLAALLARACQQREKTGAAFGV